jgi:hypothetical protein
MQLRFPLTLIFVFIFISGNAQNVGIGTNTPQAKLHVNGDLHLQNGAAINEFSHDSLFSAGSHLKVPTEKAIKDFIQKGSWLSNSYAAAGPNAPAYLGPGILPVDQANGVACSGNFAYVIGYSSDVLSIVDISDPVHLKKRGVGFGNLQTPTSIAVQGNYVYITCSGNNSLSIFDVSNPDLPVAKGFTIFNIQDPGDIVVKGNYAYVSNNLTGIITVYDISNPDAVVYKANGGVGLGGIISMDQQGNYLYVTSTFGNELHIYDISNPTALTFKGFARYEMVLPRDVAVAGNMAYVASPGNNSIVTYDISNPTAPVHKGSISGAFDAPCYVDVVGNYLAVTSSTLNRLGIFDITSPGAIAFVGSNDGNINVVTGMAVLGNVVCVANKGDVTALALFDLDLSRSIGVDGTGVAPVAATWQTQRNNVYHNNGYVGIGTSHPMQPLDVAGNINSSGELRGASLNVNAASINNANITAATFNSGSFVNTNTVNSGVSGQLLFSNNLDNKITFYGGLAASQYGIGIQSGLFQFYTDIPAADFVFGTGSSSLFTERMRIKGNGNVGIGINTPSNPLSFPATLTKKISLYPGATGDVGMSVSGNDFRLYADNPNARVSFGYDSYSTGFTSRAYVPATGAVAMVVQGQLNVNGTLYNSDIRYKKNIATLSNSLDNLLQLRGVSYKMRTNEFPEKQFTEGSQIGLIAQEVEAVFPELVYTDEKGYKSVDYVKLVPVLIEGMKAQQKKIDLQQLQLESLNKKVDLLLKSH